MHTAFPNACQLFCEHIDWSIPDLSGTPITAAYEACDIVSLEDARHAWTFTHT
jgi:hypothetical protein